MGRDDPEQDLVNYKLTEAELAINIEQYRITPGELQQLQPPAEGAIAARPKQPTASKRQFVLVPMDWVERLAVSSSASTLKTAIHVLHLNWKSEGRPFLLPNGALEKAGVSRFAKWRALAELERLGLIAIEKRTRRSPKIAVR